MTKKKKLPELSLYTFIGIAVTDKGFFARCTQYHFETDRYIGESFFLTSMSNEDGLFLIQKLTLSIETTLEKTKLYRSQDEFSIRELR